MDILEQLEDGAYKILGVLKESNAGKIKVVMNNRDTDKPMYGVFATIEPELIERLNAVCEAYDVEAESAPESAGVE